MTSQIHTQREWYSISQAQFGFLYPEQIRRLSCCQITNSQVYTSNKLAISHGLYDPSLGISPNNRQQICITCGHVGMKCSGHPGHIQLLLPVYNPIIIDVLLKMMRMNCFTCHRFRIKNSIKEDFQVIFVLVKNGLVNQAKYFWENDVGMWEKKIKKVQNEKVKEQEKEKNIRKEKIQYYEKKIKQIEEIKKKYGELASRAKQMKCQATSSSIQNFRIFVKYFYALVQNKCPYCHTLCKNIKKQGANKIFIISTSKQQITNQRKKSRDSGSRIQSANQTNDITEDIYNGKKKKQKFITQKQVYKEMRNLWNNQQKIVQLIFGDKNFSNSFAMFFLTAVFVPPNRFRPESQLGDEKYLHDQTSILAKILLINQDLRMMLIHQRITQLTEKQGEKVRKTRTSQLKSLKTTELRKQEWLSSLIKKLKLTTPQFINKWLQLQDTVNCYMDSSKASKVSDKQYKGVRQILERKEGLFRMKLMGKRVNYSARSVISPDPSLNTDEVGLPLFMAKKLTFAEHVNEYNLEKLQQYVINGKNYPGAYLLEENGKLSKLQLLNDQQRLSCARSLMINYQNKVVYRHLIDGDNVIFNRQPTLHKLGLMAHRIKVLPKQSTLRMNYANCKSYNADFDGDEMNLHVLQNYMAKAEAELCISDKLFNNPTNGKPLRQLIQDSIISAVYMTMRDTFFNKWQYCQLLYQATFSLLEKKKKNTRIFLVTPAIIKPKQLWTGKQLISNIIKLVVELSEVRYKDRKGLTMKSKTKVPVSYMKGYEEEATVIVMNNQLLTGIIDKNQVGSGADFGLIDSFNEIYGEILTGRLLTCLIKLFVGYMQVHGFSCGLDDLVLKDKINKLRKNMIEEAHSKTVGEICKNFMCKQPNNVDYYGRSRYRCDENGDFIDDDRRTHVERSEGVLMHLERKLVTEEHALEELDNEYNHHLKQKSSKIIDLCIKGFAKMFPYNNFSMMTVAGAKGSNVNHSQVSVMLGQQQLQGRRVQTMISGKTLPSFLAYDCNPRASGYISDRFLTGLRIQDFYFHCMAGRQGLIDTAVKTSRSGYLQRCLIKHMESLKVQYDNTVRDCDGSIVQFLYGEDALDPARYKFFNRFEFIKANFDIYKAKYKYDEHVSNFKIDQIHQFKKKQQGTNITQTIMEVFPPAGNLGSMSEKVYALVKDKEQIVQEVYGLKYVYNMVQPGECVGCTGAQSIGEPSTQMTLNTFHLAGHGGANLTLGIPRLRELLMTSCQKIKTPIMQLHFKEIVSKQQAKIYSRHLQKISLSQLIKDVQVQEWKQLYNGEKLLSYTQRKRFYKITINYQNEEHIMAEFAITRKDINDKLKKVVVPILLNYINRVKKRNQLRAEIKRVTITDRPQQQQQQRQQVEQPQQQKQLPPDQKNKEEKQQKPKDDSKQKNQQFKSPQFESLNFSNAGCQIQVKVALSLKKFLMTKVVQRVLKTTVVREIQGINSSSVIEGKNGYYIQTLGVHINVLKELNFIKLNNFVSNDVYWMSQRLGIEGARSTIIREIVNLFGAYGVTIDYRHLYLIGDHLTFSGRIKAMNRNWMSYSASPFLRMSFETSVKFITDAALHCQIDNCRSPSSSIILGQPPKLGTGMCDLYMDTGL